MNQRFAALSGFPEMRGHEAEIGRLDAVLSGLTDWDLFRINPLDFATRHGFDRQFLVDAFVHAAKLGLLDLSWNVVCPGCGGVEYSLTSIGDIARRSYHCIICDVGVPTEIDNQIEVAFSLGTKVRPLAIEPFTSFETYRRFFFSPNFERSPELQKYSHDNFKGFAIIPPSGQAELRINGAPSTQARALSMVSHSQMRLAFGPGSPAAEEQLVDIEIGESGFLLPKVTLSPGPVRLRIRNHTAHVNAATVLGLEEDRLREIIRLHPAKRHDFLTAKMLLNTQSYKDLFRVLSLPKDFNLQVRSLTVLFTDLTGSTSLYEQAGDLDAYHIVQEHFKVLTRVVRQHAGAIVKTMGDAVMATFSTQASAMKAGLSMIKAMEAFNAGRPGEPPIGLKVGLHEGPTLAVNTDDRIDYFGQTVNIAARVQGQAERGEVVYTEALLADPEVAQLVASLPKRPFSAKLKGLSQPMTLWAIGPGSGT